MLARILRNCNANKMPTRKKSLSAKTVCHPTNGTGDGSGQKRTADKKRENRRLDDRRSDFTQLAEPMPDAYRYQRSLSYGIYYRPRCSLG